MVPSVTVDDNTININGNIVTLTLSWGEPFNNFDPIVNYTVSCSGDVTCPPNFTTTDNTTRSYTITNLTSMINYIFSVIATNSIGSGEASVVTITPQVESTTTSSVCMTTSTTTTTTTTVPLNLNLSLTRMHSRALTPFDRAFLVEVRMQVLHALVHQFTSNKVHASTSFTLRVCSRSFLWSIESRVEARVQEFARVLSVTLTCNTNNGEIKPGK